MALKLCTKGNTMRHKNLTNPGEEPGKGHLIEDTEAQVPEKSMQFVMGDLEDAMQGNSVWAKAFGEMPNGQGAK